METNEGTLKPESLQSIGGKARAQQLTSEERTAIARNAAEARWARAPIDPNIPRIPRATHVGELKFGNMIIPCAVLENGTRVLSERAVTKALGGKRGGAHWRRMKEGGAEIPVYISANNFKPLISKGLLVALSTPILYKPKSGSLAHGLAAELLPEVCEVFLKARDTDKLHPSQRPLAAKADILMRGLAHVGIIALVDEATGYQLDRAKEALAEILEKFIAKELREWTKTFPLEFYEHIFRLKGWVFNSGNVIKKPSVIGHYTNDIIYKRLAPGVLKVLREKNPRVNGHRKHKLFQWLSGDIGHPKLRSHIDGVLALMRVSESWDQFRNFIKKAFPIIEGEYTPRTGSTTQGDCL